MPFSATQQKKLDDAQALLDSAKAAYLGNVQSYNEYANAIAPCYTHAVPSASDASTWFNSFDKGPCTGKGSCDLSQCKDRVDVLNTIIPNLKSTYASLQSAQANYDKVTMEVAAEVKSDPTTILQQAEIAASAESKKYKWIFGIVVVLIIGGAIFVYFKWFKKKG